MADLSLFFTDGYLGTVGNNTNQANGIKTFSTLGISRAAIVQADTDGDGLFDVGTQGNDVPVTIKLYLTNGTVLSLNSAINWRETTGSTLEVMGVVFDSGESASIPYASGSTFTITGGSTRDVATSLGIKAFGSTFTFADNTNRTGNAANNMVDELNAQLAAIPAPSSIALSNTTIVEGGNLVYTVTLSASTTATQYFSISLSGSATRGSDYDPNSDLANFTFSNGVTYVGNGSLSVPTGVSSFTVTIPTTDDAAQESAETVELQIGNKTATGTISDNDWPSLSYSTGTFAESNLNDGSISTTITITLTGDTFAAGVVSNSKVSASNVPAGLSASFTRVSDTQVSMTLTGNATAHANAQDINNLTVTFADSAFTNTATASNVTNYLKSDLVVDFADPLGNSGGGGSSGAGSTSPQNITTDLNPQSDTGDRDRITRKIDPDISINAGDLLQTDRTVRLLDSKGGVVSSKLVSADEIQSGVSNISPGVLDDGVYTFKSQVLEKNGGVLGEALVTIEIVTDRDGVAPSIELAANGGDFNRDGVKDWEQNNVAQLPLLSLDAFSQGKDAAKESFGAIIAGSLDRDSLGVSASLNGNAQLIDLAVNALPEQPTPEGLTAVTPLFQFSLTSQDSKVLLDTDSGREGTQVQAVIDLPAGVKATSYIKFNSQTNEWVDFTNLSSLDGNGDGAVLIDSNRDGLVDRVLLTLTDGGPGDEDGIANGVVVDPGALATFDDLAFYAERTAWGDTFLRTDATNEMTGIDFYASPNFSEGLMKLKGYFNPFTNDYFYAPEGVAAPYACFQEITSVEFGYVAAVGQGAFDLHLYMNAQGLTEILSEEAAADRHLTDIGYKDYGGIFASTQDINIVTLVGTDGYFYA